MANGGVQIDPSVADLLQTEEGTAEFAELMAVVSLQQMGMLAPAPWCFTRAEDTEYRRLHASIAQRYGWSDEELSEKATLANFPDDSEMQAIFALNTLRLRRIELLERK